MPNVVRITTPQGTAGFPAVAATLYSCAAQLRAQGTTRNGRVNIAWYNAAGALISRSSDAWKSVTSAAWIGSQIVGQAAPALTAFMALEVEFDANIGEIFYTDQMILATGSNPAWGPGGFSSNAKFIVERSPDLGVTWEEVRGARRVAPAAIDAGSSVAQATLYDREAPLRALTRWRGYAQTGVAPAEVVSAAVTSVDQTITANSWWLRDPSDSTRDVAIRQAEMSAKYGPGVAGTTFFPEGRTLPLVVHSNQPSGAVFELKIWTLDKANHDKVMTMLASRRVLFVQNSLGQRWYVKVTGEPTYEHVRAAPLSTEITRLRHFHQASCEVTQVLEPTP